MVAEGIDPSASRKADKSAIEQKRVEETRAEAGLPPLGSFEAVAREWLESIHGAKVSDGHADRTRNRLEQDLFPWIGRKPIGDIERPGFGGGSNS